MEDITDLTAQMNQPLVLWIAIAIAAVFILFIIYDGVRRRRLRARSNFGGRRRTSRPNYFKRAAAFFHELNQEMQRRKDRNDRRRDRR